MLPSARKYAERTNKLQLIQLFFRTSTGLWSATEHKQVFAEIQSKRVATASSVKNIFAPHWYIVPAASFPEVCTKLLNGILDAASWSTPHESCICFTVAADINPQWVYFQRYTYLFTGARKWIRRRGQDLQADEPGENVTNQIENHVLHHLKMNCCKCRACYQRQLWG